MLKTIISGENLPVFLNQIEEQSLRKMDNLALLSEDFFTVTQKLLEKNYKVELVEVNDDSLLADTYLHIVNIKLKK